MRLNIALRVFFLLPLFLLAGCVTPGGAHEFLRQHQIKQPYPDHFQVCTRSGCIEIAEVGYHEHEWTTLEQLFVPAPENPIQERERIAAAVALMEQMVGRKANTSGDRPRNTGWFAGSPQLDCIAESANTTVAISLLQSRGLLYFHRAVYPSHRGLLSFQFPHNAATIEELASKQQFVVDSWFYANGEPPVIVPVEIWKAGYDPDE